MKYLLFLPLIWLAGCTTLHQVEVQLAQEYEQADPAYINEYTNHQTNEQTDACAKNADTCQAALLALEAEDPTEAEPCINCSSHFGISVEQRGLLDAHVEFAGGSLESDLTGNMRLSALFVTDIAQSDDISFAGFGVDFYANHRPNHWYAGFGGSFTDSCIWPDDNRDHCLIAKRFALHGEAGVQAHLFNLLRLQLYTRPTGVIGHLPIAPPGYGERVEAVDAAGSDWHFDAYTSWGTRLGVFF